MATIIRKDSFAEQTSGRTVRSVAFNFEDMNDRANEYLESVRREAAKVVQQAHQQAEQVRRQAEVAGRAAAEQAAQRGLEEKLSARIATMIAALDQLVSQANAAQDEWVRRWEQAAVAVATAIAERVIRREVAQRPEISLDLVREALRLAAGAAEITLHLSPADYELLGASTDALAQSLGRLAPTRVVADATITDGGCVVHTSEGCIDQQIKAQLARIQQELN